MYFKFSEKHKINNIKHNFIKKFKSLMIYNLYKGMSQKFYNYKIVNAILLSQNNFLINNLSVFIN